jgi:hypothetical protein
MQAEQLCWRASRGWSGNLAGPGTTAQLALIFGATSLLNQPERLEEIRASFPNAYLLGCSTAGEIAGTNVLDDSLVLTAVHFDHTHLVAAEVDLQDVVDSRDAGATLASSLDPHGLVHVFVISDGLKINGSELVEGLVCQLPAQVAVTGGLSGDGARFEKTLVCAGGSVKQGRVAAVGFYGDRLDVGYGSMGGWDSFGPERLITRSKGNILYQLDGQNALELYRTYLGEHAAQLPASGLLFPLSVRAADSSDSVVRTILSVSESEHSMTFAGDIPQGSQARLMRANFGRLVDGAHGAAQVSRQAMGEQPPTLAILISCVGRKLVLKQRVEDEIEAVRDVLGESTVMTGFYSYGEVSPFCPSARCQLHNQTMTITTFAEH